MSEQHVEGRVPFEPMYLPLRWSRVSRRRYTATVTAWTAAMAAGWLISFEPWPVALRTVILIQLLLLAVDGVRYWFWRRRAR
jgi:hypothetical protein